MTAVNVLARYEDLPARNGAAAQVLMLADAPDTTATDLAEMIGTDPAFAARVISLANSAYYGLSGRVGTLHYAVSVIGFQTIRAMAVTIAAGMTQPNSVPEGFWEQAAAAASAAALLAPLLGSRPGDAFSVGLLHTLGSALLHQVRPLPTLCLPAPHDLDIVLAEEEQLYGINHSVLGAEVLRNWHFPEVLCKVIAEHHDAPLPTANALNRTLHGARALADLVLNPDAESDRAKHTLTWLSEGRLAATDVDPLLHQLRAKTDVLLDGLRPSSH